MDETGGAPWNADVFDYIERASTIHAAAFDARLYESHRVRNEGAISLGWCQRNPQQPKNVTYGTEAIIEMGGMSH